MKTDEIGVGDELELEDFKQWTLTQVEEEKLGCWMDNKNFGVTMRWEERCVFVRDGE